MDWCRNVGENYKTFLGGVGSGNAKHRTSWEQTSVLSKQNIGTLPSRSPMFLISRRAAKFRRHPVHQGHPVSAGKSKDRNQSLALDARCLLVDSMNSLCQVFELFLLYNYLGNATFVSCARQSANKFARCARLAKRSFAHHT